MNLFCIIPWMIIVALGVASPAGATAADEPGATAGKEYLDTRPSSPAPANATDVKLEPQSQAVQMLVYRPPLRGAPRGTVAGGTRGVGKAALQLFALAPDHVGLTTQEQPVLYWYLSGLPPFPMEFSIIEAGAIRPLLEIRLTSPSQAGIQAVRLADHGVRLKRGQQYQWYIAMVQNPEQRSKDLIAGAEIEVIEPSKALSAELGRAGKSGAHYVYADQGIWYDALMALSDLTEAAPEQALFREQRASLFQQVGLHEVAEAERKRADSPTPKP